MCVVTHAYYDEKAIKCFKVLNGGLTVIYSIYQFKPNDLHNPILMNCKSMIQKQFFNLELVLLFFLHIKTNLTPNNSILHIYIHTHYIQSFVLTL